MMNRSNNTQGTMVMFLETDLQKVSAFDENNLTPLQRQAFIQLSDVEQEKIRGGYGTVIISLENGEHICEW